MGDEGQPQALKSRVPVKKGRKQANVGAIAKVTKDPGSYKTYGANFIWVPHPEDGYGVGEIKVRHATEVEVQTEQGETVTIPRNEVQPINPPRFEGTNDMSNLTYLNEASILYNLKQRYNMDKIYTYSGLFLIAINPYKPLPIYEPDIVDRYKGRRREELEPHIFAVSDQAYREMMMNKKNQSMLITGESGAGKTENTKKVIQYLTAIAGVKTSAGRGKLEEQILQANPIMESLGNAKTIKNNNSSRFGKFIEIQFNNGGMITGCAITTYLLEKSRVVHQANSERNFHFFYQITQGANPQEKSRWCLRDWKDYSYINKTDPFIEGVNDATDFRDTIKALEIVGFSPEEIEFLCASIAGVLNMGNVNFKAKSNGYAQLENREYFNNACKLWSVDAQQLENALTKPLTKFGAEIIPVEQTPDQAVFNRDALVKYIYQGIFDWVVKKINQSLTAKDKIATCIGVLDIAGFEIFDHNSFEQLCINYTNEKLQQFFNHHMFKKEQEEYLKEQIEWTFIDFGLDLQDTIDLIEQNPGILKAIDDKSITGNTNEEQLTNHLLTSFKNHPRMLTDADVIKFSKTKFGLDHYAATVIYDTTNWIVKNTEPLHEDAKVVMSTSTATLLRACLTPQQTNSGATLVNQVQKGAQGAASRGVRISTVSAKYKEQLGNLMSVLNATEPHFIRCIIPNLMKRPGAINASLVLDQLRCNGVLEGIRIARKGYPNRMIFEEFYKRYQILAPKVRLDELTGFKAKTAYIMDHLKIEPEQFKIGITKIFLRAGQLGQLEDFRDQKLAEIIVHVQNAARGAIARNYYKQLRVRLDAIKTIQRNWRSYTSIHNWSWYQLFIKLRPLLNTIKTEELLKSKDEELNKLKSDLEKEAEQKKKLEKIKMDLESTVDGFRTSVIEAKNENTKLSGKVGELENRLREIGDALDTEAKRRAAIGDDKKSLELKLFQQEQVNADARKQSENLQKQLAALQNELSKFKSDLGEQQGKNSNLSNEKGSLERKLQELQSILDQEKTKANSMDQRSKTLGKDLDELREMLAKEQREKQSLATAIKKLEGDLKETKTAKDGEAKKADDLSGSIRKLQSDMQRMQSELDDEKRQKGDISRRAKQLETELGSTAQAKEEEEKEKARVIREKRSLEQQVEDLRSQLEGALDGTSNLDNLTKQQLQQLQELQNQLSQREAALATENSNRQNAERLLRDLQTTSEDEINRLKSTLESNKRKLEQDVAETKAQLEDALRNFQNADRNRVRLERELQEKAQALNAESLAKNSLEDVVRRLEAEIRDLKAKLEEETRKRQQLEQLNRRLQGQIDSLSGDVNSTVEEKERLNRMVAQHKREMEELNSRIGDTESELSSAKSSRDELSVKLQDAQRQLDDRTADAKKYEAQVALLKQEIIATQGDEASKAAQALDRLKRQYQQQVDQLEAQLAEARGEADKNKKKLSDEGRKVGKQLQDAQSALSSAESEISRLKSELASLRASLEDRTATNAEIEGVKRNYELQLQQLNGRISELESEKNKVQDSERRFKQQFESVKKDLEDEESDKEDAQRKAQELQSKLDAAARDLALIQSKAQDLEADKARLQAELSAARDESLSVKQKSSVEADGLKRRLESRVAELQKEVEEANSGKRDLADEVKDLNKELRDAERQISELKAKQGVASAEQVRALENNISKLHQDLEGAVRTKATAEAQVRDLEDRLKSVASQLEDEARTRKRIDDDRKKLQQDLNDLSEEADEADVLRSDLKSLRSEFDSRVALLTSELSKLKEEKDSAEVSSNRYRVEVDSLIKQLEDSKKRTQDEVNAAKRKSELALAEMEEKMRKNSRDKESGFKASKTLQREVRDLQSRLEEELRASSEARQRASSLETQVKKLQLDTESFSTKYRTAELERASLESRTRDSELDRTRLSDEVSSLRKQLDEERTKRRRLERKLKSVYDSDDE